MCHIRIIAAHPCLMQDLTKRPEDSQAATVAAQAPEPQRQPASTASPWAGAASAAVPALQVPPSSPAQQVQPPAQSGAAWAPRQPVPTQGDFPALHLPKAAATPAAVIPAALSAVAAKAGPVRTAGGAGSSSGVGQAGTPVSATPSSSGSKLSLKDFIRSDHGGRAATPGGGAGKAGGKATSWDGRGHSRQGGGAGDGGVTATPGSARVCWLEELGIGDYVAVEPLAATPGADHVSDGPPGAEHASQGFIEEILTDEPYQPKGVLVRLHDNTLGYAVQLVAKRGPAAAEAAKAHARWLRERHQGNGDGSGGANTIFAPRLGQSKSHGGSSQQLQRATSHDSSVPGRQGSADGRPGPAAGAGAGADTAAVHQQDAAAWGTWEVYVQQYGEALTSAVLEDCGGDVHQALRTLEVSLEHTHVKQFC